MIVVDGFTINKFLILPHSAITGGDNFHQRWINRIRGRKVNIEHKTAPAVRSIYRASNKRTDKVHTVFVLHGQ